MLELLHFVGHGFWCVGLVENFILVLSENWKDLTFGLIQLGDVSDAAPLRAELADYIEANSTTVWGDNTLEEIYEWFSSGTHPSLRFFLLTPTHPSRIKHV